MAPRGTFPDADPSELVALVDKRIVNRNPLGALVARINAVTVRPAGSDASAPQAWIGRPGLFSRKPTMNVTAPGIEARMVQQRIADAGLSGPEPRKSFGQLMYDFPPDMDAQQVVDFALGALRALGAPTAGGWEYEGQAPQGE